MNAHTSLAREASLDALNAVEMSAELRRLALMNAAYADMVSATFAMDGSYESARDRFNAVRDGVQA